MSAIDELRRSELNDVKWQMDSERGRKFIWRILEMCRVFNTVCRKFNEQTQKDDLCFDPGMMALNEGARNVGLNLFNEIMEVAPKKYMVMALEAKERSELLKAQLEKEKEMNDE